MFNNKDNNKDNKDAEDVNEMDDDDDSNEAVGIEEAIILDSNIDDDDDDDDNDDDDCDGVTAEDSKTLPSVTTTPPPPPPGGKVTTMLQKILSLGGAAAQAAAGTALPIDEAGDDANDANNGNDINENIYETPSALTTSNDDDDSSPTSATTTTTTTTSGTGTPQVVYPRSIEVSRTDVRHPSVIHNGRLVCNLPDHPIHAGATAVVAVITGKILTVANAGDSRAVLCRRRHRSRIVTDDGTDDGTDVDTGHYAFPLSYDHKPSQTHELNRILCSGGFVNHFGRINGNLNLSRSIGDLKYKQVPGIPPEDQMITAEPDIMQIVLKDDDEFIILGCDGIWDCLSNEQAVNFVANRIQTKTPVEIGTEMLDEIISDDPRITQGIGGDNMTIMIIDLQTSNRLRRKITTSDADPLLGRGGGGFGNDADKSSKENDNDVNNNTTSEVAAME
jgi:serine/threonine protein phosphatase PrpC